MKYRNLIPGEFVWRDNRFTAAVRINSELTHAHIANSGRLPGLLLPGTKVYLTKAGHRNRRTDYDLKLVFLNDEFISVDATLPNYLFEEAVINKRLNDFLYTEIHREVSIGKSRIDFLLNRDDEACWVEVKSVTLVEGKIAKFPDAPTKRGRKHLEELRKMVSKGDKASVVFIVQRKDAVLFQPNWSIDPDFSKTLYEAASNDIMVRAYRCRVNLEKIEVSNEIPCIIKKP
jgi:sugar fermentation stimulation protein A